MPLNRSHITALLLTVFALTVLGVAAGTLDSAQPNVAYTPGDGGEPTSGGKGAAQSQSPTDDSSSGHFLLPELNITNNLQDEQAQSGGVLTRLVLGVFLLVFGAGLVLWHLTSDGSSTELAADDEIDTLANERTPYTTSPDARNVPVTNGVYRAWQAMIAALDVDKADNKTPAELAEAAIEAGFPASTVSTLTELFCNVRYGKGSPTNKQEQHAQEAIEEIRQAAQLDDPNQSDSASEP